ncbi:MAG: glycosyltransferase family 9 protein [Verrucomicrobia bacterium]|nr:glycosyltransferase family 9 protein [Verrucomicrobiota bacterium]
MKKIMKAPGRILLVKPSSLGDVIQSLPVVSAIHRHWPEAELRWLIHPAWRSLVEHHPGVSGTVLFPRDKFRGPRGWIRSLAWLKTLSDWKPDLAIDLQGLLRSALFARLSGAPRVVGLSDAREGARLLHGERAIVNRAAHAVSRYLSVLDLLGIPCPTHPEFELPEGRLPVGFSPEQPYVVIHPYSRGEGKSLTPEMIRSFAAGAAPVRVVIVGKGDPGNKWPQNVEDWSNRTDLLELTAILRGASFIVSSDSGPMHLAAALHPERTLAIHLWSDPLKVGPCFPESLVWKNGRISRVAELDDSWRAEGRAPSAIEMEELGQLGRLAAAKSMKSEG